MGMFVCVALAFGESGAAAQGAKSVEDCGIYAYKAEITKVYDGDTVTANIDLGFRTWRRGEKLRLWGIDAPEVRGESRPEGLKSRDALRERVLGKSVIVCTIKDKTGKYGRYLAEIFLDDVNINHWLMEAGHAGPYLAAAQSDLWSLGGGQRFERVALPASGD